MWSYSPTYTRVAPRFAEWGVCPSLGKPRLAHLVVGEGLCAATETPGGRRFLGVAGVLNGAPIFFLAYG